MKIRTELDAELSTFIIDKLNTEAGRHELLEFLRDTVRLMCDQHDVEAIARALRYAGIDLSRFH